MATFPSDEWLAGYRDAINHSDAYRQKAADWEGDITYVVEADPEKGITDTGYAWVDLWHGTCRDAKLVSIDEAEKAAYVITGPYKLWKAVLQGEVDPVKAMVQGKLRLRGDLPKMASYVDATRELVSIATSIPTTFPDE